MDVEAVPLTELTGKSGVLRDQWLDYVTQLGVAPRNGGVRKLVYAMAYHANKDSFEVWPGVETLADRVAIGQNTVRAAFKWLTANGWLILTRKGGGRAATNHYILSIPASLVDEE